MKKIYLTEQQLNYLIDCEVINESNIIQTIFSGCNTREEKIQRVFSLAKKGVITLGILSAITLMLLPNSSKQEQEQFKLEVEQVMPDTTKTIVDNNIYAKDFNISNNGIEHIMSYEKKRLDAYYATESERKRGILTIGIGHVINSNDSPEIRNLKEGDKISEETMKKLFEKDILTHINEFKKSVRLLPKHLQDPSLYTQGFIDAAISLTFNAGQPNMVSSEFYQTWKKCRIDKSTGKIKKEDYNYTVSKLKTSCITQKGKVLNGLKNRRYVEYNMAQLK